MRSRDVAAEFSLIATWQRANAGWAAVYIVRGFLRILTVVGVILNPTTSEEMAFRVQGKHILLTYAQAERIQTKESLLQALRDKVPSPIAWIVAKEQHADGNFHYHALLKFERRIDVRAVDFWDVEGHHPNIVTCRAPARARDYVIKDGDYISEGFVVEQVVDIFQVVQEEVAARNDPTAAIKAIIERTGTAGLRMYNNISSYVDRIMVPDRVHEPEKVYPDAFVIPEAMRPYLHQFVVDMAYGHGQRGNRKSLWLHGPSRLGKTVIARSLGRHWYMMGSWNIDGYSDDAQYGVLDDIDWERMKPFYKGLLGLQRNVTVTDKYKPKREIAGGKPVIVLTNDLPMFTLEEAQWLAANVNFYQVTEKLFE